MSAKNELMKIRNEITRREETSETIGAYWFYQFLNKLLGNTKKEELAVKQEENRPVGILEVKKESVILDDKVDDFILWFSETLVKGNYTDIGEYKVPFEMRNFIEKMASWYEMRYPDYEINRLMPCSGQENKSVNDEMFKNNPYVKDMVGNGTDIECFDWCDFYNFNAFYNSLSSEEQYYLNIPTYPNLVYFNNYGHIHLDKNGYIEEAEGIPFLSDVSLATNIPHIKDILTYIIDAKIPIPENCEIARVVTNVENRTKRREDMLDCVMYRIIERGGNRFGPRRALLFAKEFNRDVSIPMIYGVDTSDPGLRKFIMEYFKAGGSKDISCFVNYFSRASKYETMQKVSMRKLLRTTPDDCFHKYMKEETEAHQKLVNILAYQASLKESGNKWTKMLKLVNSFGKKEDK